MEIDKPSLDPDSEVAKAIAALNELRDVLNEVSLNLKDLTASRDFAAHGNAWLQSSALMDGLFNSLTSKHRGNATTNTGGGG